jgi:diguanylate cyclase (GGDEF)-like protein
MKRVRSGRDPSPFEGGSAHGRAPVTDLLAQAAPSGAGVLPIAETGSANRGPRWVSGLRSVRSPLWRQRRAGILPAAERGSISARPSPGPESARGYSSGPIPANPSAVETGAAPALSTLRTLLCCDHRGDGLAASLARVGSRGHRIVEIRDPRACLEAIETGAPDLVVLDPLAEGGTAELDEIDRRREGRPKLPLLFVVGAASGKAAALAERLLARGAADLVHRGAPPEEFAMRIERLLALAASEVEIADLRHRAVHDDRTDLLRATAFEQRLLEHFSASERHGLRMALVLVDLDAFGLVNKEFDHTVGDRVIERVGEAVRSALRAEDVAGRLGGDEFGAILPYTGRLDAAHAVRRLLDAIRSVAGERAGLPAGLEVRASLGFETFDGSDLRSCADLRSHAETALREAKRRGGDRGVYFRSLSRTGEPGPG